MLTKITNKIKTGLRDLLSTNRQRLLLENMDEDSLRAESIVLSEAEHNDIPRRSLPKNLAENQLNNEANRSGMTFRGEFTKPLTEFKKLYKIYGGTLDIVTDIHECHFYSLKTATGKELVNPGLVLQKDLSDIDTNHVETGIDNTPVQHFKSGCFCLEIWSGNYFHWLILVLPKIHYLKTLLGDKMPPLLMTTHSEIPSIVQASLELIGIHQQDCVDINNGKVAVDELYFPSISKFNRSMLLSLRNKITETFQNNSNEGQFIYISRRNAAKRKCHNENELEECLRDFGFTLIQAENFSFSEQIQTFRNAKIVCGLHGAGLSNILFMPEGSQVIEIGSYGDPSPLFYSLANALTLDYWYVEATPDSDSSNGDADISVNISSLLNVLKQATASN